ncbi:snRNA-activating protein complex subunit 1 [Microtus ochrogaster]|uniref:snRNA-activating protein complex subunit 1 n=1 Tax=Microtus ochrogaster TaxID=79684 RepID=A0A8J6H1N2_MICOH|nr:snRNA-activating protein complex subunit 1 [Microtus ochrogaster]
MGTPADAATRSVGAGSLEGVGIPPGLQTDCEALLSRFQEMDSVRFEDFAELWRSMKFATIFCGKMRNLKKNLFTKEALALAWRYFLPPYTFQIRVGALYLLYGLYNTQLCQPKQKIRVALQDWDDVIRFQQDLINAQHFDAAFVFRKLRLDRAFHFTAMPKLEMLNVHDHYQNMKHAISADKTTPDKALSLVKEDFFDTIKNIVLEHQQWHEDRKNPSLKPKLKDGEEESESTSQEPERCERAESLAKIKAKAFSAVAQCHVYTYTGVPQCHMYTYTGVPQCHMYTYTGVPQCHMYTYTAVPQCHVDTYTGNVQNDQKEEKSLRLSMPIIAEEAEETDDFSEAGTGASHWLVQDLGLQSNIVRAFQVTERRLSPLTLCPSDCASSEQPFYSFGVWKMNPDGQIVGVHPQAHSSLLVLQQRPSTAQATGLEAGAPTAPGKAQGIPTEAAAIREGSGGLRHLGQARSQDLGPQLYKRHDAVPGQAAEAQGGPQLPSMHYCEVCRISCTRLQTYEHHLEGQKHRKKQAAPLTGTQFSGDLRGARSLHCNLCAVSCTGVDACAAHVRRTRYQKLYTRLGKPITSEPTP